MNSKFWRSKTSEVAFIRGFQRSGTNWLCRILNLHPEINCKGEFHFENLYKEIARLKSNRFGYFKNNPQALDQEFQNFITNIISSECNNAPICIDRTPCSLHDTYTPKNKFILITRDGRDCIVSWVYHCLRLNIIQNDKMKEYKKQFDIDPDFFEKNKHELLEMPHFIKGLARRWNKMIMDDVPYSTNSNVYWIKYEDLILSTDQYRYEIYEFLGLKHSKAQQLDKATKAGFTTHNALNHNRIGKSGRWKEYFTEEQTKWFNSEAQEAIELLGLK